MAGYMKKLNSYVFDGEYVSDVDLKSGEFVKITAGKVVKAAGSDVTLTKIADESVYGVAGERARVDAVNGLIYMVEPQHDVNDSVEYDYATYVVKAGEKVRMHPLSVGEELVHTV